MVEVSAALTIGGKLVTLGKAAKRAIDWYKENPANRRMREAGELFDTVREVASAEYLSRREAEARDQEAFRTAVEVMLADHQFARLQGVLEFEAAREATDERLELLGYAAAGLANPDLTINEKARIERALRQLDGDDVLFLDELDRFDDPTFTYDPANGNPEEKQRLRHNAKGRLLKAQDKQLSRVALTVAGCIAEDNGSWGGPSLAVTPLATQMLLVLRPYINRKRNA